MKKLNYIWSVICLSIRINQIMQNIIFGISAVICAGALSQSVINHYKNKAEKMFIKNKLKIVHNGTFAGFPYDIDDYVIQCSHSCNGCTNYGKFSLVWFTDEIDISHDGFLFPIASYFTYRKYYIPTWFSDVCAFDELRDWERKSRIETKL